MAISTLSAATGCLVKFFLGPLPRLKIDELRHFVAFGVHPEERPSALGTNAHGHAFGADSSFAIGAHVGKLGLYVPGVAEMDVAATWAAKEHDVIDLFQRDRPFQLFKLVASGRFVGGNKRGAFCLFLCGFGF